MRPEKEQIMFEALLNQLGHLRARTRDLDAAQWRKLGKLAQDFTVWLERARPWISCASSLIALRVEQVLGEADPQSPSEKSLKKMSDLLDEAARQLVNPGQPIQVLDLDRNENLRIEADQETCFVPGGVSLPTILIEIPEILRPKGNAPVQFLYIIPN